MMVETVETGSRGHSPIVDQPMGNGLQWKEGPGAARIANALIVDQTPGGGGDPQWTGCREAASRAGLWRQVQQGAGHACRLLAILL